MRIVSSRKCTFVVNSIESVVCSKIPSQFTPDGYTNLFINTKSGKGLVVETYRTVEDAISEKAKIDKFLLKKKHQVYHVREGERRY